MYVLVTDPLVVQVGIALPFDQILKGASSAILLRVQNLLYLVLLLIVDQVWRWSRIICSVELRFLVWREKIDVEHVVNAPLCGKFQSVIDGQHHLNDGKGAMSFGCKLCCRLIGAQVAPF